MRAIPVTFEHNGKQYSGVLSQVQGAGETGVYHLTVNKYYKGRLRFSSFTNSWVFDGEFEELAEKFAEFIR
jgi:hypothetical protein